MSAKTLDTCEKRLYEFKGMNETRGWVHKSVDQRLLVHSLIHHVVKASNSQRILNNESSEREESRLAERRAVCIKTLNKRLVKVVSDGKARDS